MSRVELTFTSDLASPPDRVWRWITSVRGISQELAPVLKMTAPEGVTDIADVKVQPGQPLFRSWVLLFGILPVDRSDLTLLSLEPGTGFVEQSPMLSMKVWRHERHLEESGEGTLLTDRLTFQPRLATFVIRWFIRTVFNHRHRVLQQHFGVRSASRASGFERYGNLHRPLAAYPD
jgi:ligand-binding SRPBCC domain-containing protein